MHDDHLQHYFETRGIGASEGLSYSVLLQCVAVCCSVLQWVAVGCNVLQCVAVCRSVLQCSHELCCCSESVLECVGACCSVLQSIAVCCSVLQCAHELAASVLQKFCLIVCCSLVQSVAVTRGVDAAEGLPDSLLQSVAGCHSILRRRSCSFDRT